MFANFLFNFVDVEGYDKIGKISYNPKHELGSGSVGTLVLKGFVEKREVAVKRCLMSMWSKTADNEASCLIASDHHPNIIRYFVTEKSEEFVYIALQLCETSLELWIAGHNSNLRTNKISILTDTLEGLAHLHNLKPRALCHRDIKPSNILLYSPDPNVEARDVIADLGMSKLLEDATTQTFTTTAGKTMGTAGWRAPEVLQNLSTASDVSRGKLSLQLDIFPTGCLIYFLLTDGKHPFGDDLIRRDTNVLDNKFLLSALKTKHSIYKDLIEKMISHDSKTRPTAEQALESFKTLTNNTGINIYILMKAITYILIMN